MVVYNNYLTQNMHREANRTTPTSDLERLKRIANWIERHKGYMPDINSENTKEAKMAIAIAREGGSVAKVARKQLEEKLGRSVISSSKASDFLPPPAEEIN